MIDQNFIQIVVDVIVNCGFCEDSICIGLVGIVCRQVVDVFFFCCVNQVIFFFIIGVCEVFFCNVKLIVECFVEEFINVVKGFSNFYVIKKKDELECVVKSNW